MPSFIWSDALTANQLGQAPIAGWQFERVPSAFVSGAYLAVLQRATTVNVRQSIFSGSQNIQQRTPVREGELRARLRCCSTLPSWTGRAARTICSPS